MDEGIREFSIHLAHRPLASNTRKAFVGDVRIFARYLAEQHRGAGDAVHDINMVDVTTDDIAGFLQSLESGHVAHSPKSLERRLTSLKVMFKWFYETGRLLRDPADGVPYKPFMDPLP
ncbi:MAG TPA: site-specific integrase, partial [Anaerolineae bacterium]